jgi:hypothetical protein
MFNNSFIQIEVDSVEEVICTTLFYIKKGYTDHWFWIRSSVSISDDSPSPSCDTQFTKVAAAA